MSNLTYLLFLFRRILLMTCMPLISLAQCTIVLDPAGDAQYAGRMLEDYYERGATLQFCHDLKRVLEFSNPTIRVILTRMPGEPATEQLTYANFANRLNADFYLSVHFYKENDIKPKLWIFHYLNEKNITYNVPALYFWPLEQAHLINIKKTIIDSNIFYTTLSTLEDRFFETQPVLGLPFKPLFGLKPAALAIEIGIKKNSDIKKFIEPVALAIEKIMQ